MDRRVIFMAMGLTGMIFHAAEAGARLVRGRRPNVVVILADDLGYGDLGWGPFSGQDMRQVETPNLRSMARNGLTMTNFHTASPVCSPSRASIMVGLFPWRMGIDFIYAGGESTNINICIYVC